jgi:hypothetical protein
MGRLQAAIAVVAVACTPDGDFGGASGSLFLMNQTHETQRLARFRGSVDCARGSADPNAELERAAFAFEGCVTLAPADVIALDRNPYSDARPACDAVALEGGGLAPRALFWNDTSYGYSGDPAKAGAVLLMVAVGRKLELEPAAAAAMVRVASLPETRCTWQF